MEKLRLVPLKQTILQDSFLAKYASLVSKVIIPYQWAILNDQVAGAEESHSIANFEIAAGRKEGEFHGAVFQDTDVAKWLEAVACSLATTPDKQLESLADDVIALLEEAQGEDGYLDTYFLIKEPDSRWTNLMEGHELYTAGHLIEAGVAYFKTTGKDKLLHIVCRFADLICNVFSEKEKSKGYPGHQEIELALVRLYEVTENRKYLDLAKQFIDQRGYEPNYFLEEEKKPEFKRIFPEFAKYQPIYSQSHLPVRQQKTAEGHAVRATYMYAAMADLAYEFNDKELLTTCETIWNNITTRRMYLTGSIGSSGILERFTTDYDLPNDRNYSETCASIGLMLFARRMAQITRDAKYVEVIEKVVYNTLLSSIAKDGKSFFYVNPLEVWPDNCIDRTSMEHVKPARQKWFGVACCPPNIARTLASLGEYIYFSDKKTIYINLFIASETTVECEGGKVQIKQETNYPFDGAVKLTVTKEKQQDVQVAIRIPRYITSYKQKQNGEYFENTKRERGYEILQIIEEQTVIELDFDLMPRFIYANSEVRADNGKVALQLGPVVYCLEEVDNGKNLSAIYLDTSKPVSAYHDESLGEDVKAIKMMGKRRKKTQWMTKELYEEEKPIFEDIEITAVPYGIWGNRTPGEMLVWVNHTIV